MLHIISGERDLLKSVNQIPRWGVGCENYGNGVYIYHTSAFMMHAYNKGYALKPREIRYSAICPKAAHTNI